MKVEQYIQRLQQLAADHPGARMIATDYGDDYHEGGEYDVAPQWSERDQVIAADCSDLSDA